MVAYLSICFARFKPTLEKNSLNPSAISLGLLICLLFDVNDSGREVLLLFLFKISFITPHVAFMLSFESWIISLKCLFLAIRMMWFYYGNIVWANNYPSKLKYVIYKMQKKALCIITISSYNINILHLMFQKLELLNLYH